jgi:AcrR family transcriptional regulator
MSGSKPPLAGELAVSASPKPRGHTRERILSQALQQFNDLGEPSVTMAAIGESLRISPGNLYYHFASKERIVTELFERFETEVGSLLDQAAQRTIVLEDVRPFIRLLFELIWRYRFVYRDTNELLARHRSLELGLQTIVRRQRALSVLLCEALRSAGELDVTAADIDALTTNMLVVASGWLAFEYIEGARRFDDAAFAEASLARGVEQLLALLQPWLTVAARERLIRSRARA